MLNFSCRYQHCLNDYGCGREGDVLCGYMDEVVSDDECGTSCDMWEPCDSADFYRLMVEAWKDHDYDTALEIKEHARDVGYHGSNGGSGKREPEDAVFQFLDHLSESGGAIVA